MNILILTKLKSNILEPHHKNVNDYIKGCLISCQTDFFNQETTQEKVAEWCEEILVEMYGESVVKKWRY